MTKKKISVIFWAILSCVCLLFAVLFSGVRFNAYADTIESLEINERKAVDINGYDIKRFSITLTDTKFYVVETIGTVDTFMSVYGLSEGMLIDTDSGEGDNACIAFRGENTTIEIHVSGGGENAVGQTTLQIRRQQAIMFGFDYPKNDTKKISVLNEGEGIDTRPDLDVPASVLEPLYNIARYDTDNVTPLYFDHNDERGIIRQNSEILFFSGHGFDGYFVSLPRSEFYVYKIKDMSNTKVAVWSACNSASQNNKYNSSMVHKSVEKGAKSSIGWVDSIYNDSAKKFTDAFFTALAQGKTVKQAADKGKSKIFWLWDSVRKYTLVGNGDTTITSANLNKSVKINNTMINEFKQRGSNGGWVRYEDGLLQARYYHTINGCLTNDYYDVTYNDNNEIIDVIHSGYYIENQQVLLASNFDTTTLEKAIKNSDVHNVYVLIKDNVVPVKIEYKKADGAENGSMQVVCTNLNNGNLIDYAEIC